MSAEVDLAARCEPAQAVCITFRNRKGSFRKIVLDRDLLHQIIRQRRICHADGCGIARKYMLRKRIDNILLHEAFSLASVRIFRYASDSFSSRFCVTGSLDSVSVTGS